MKYYNLFVESSREPDKRFIWIKKQVPYYYAAEGWTPLRALGKAEKIDWDDILEKPNLVTKEELEETFKGYYTKTEIDDLLSKKLDKTTYEAFLKTYGEFLKSHEKHVEDFNDHVNENKKHEEEYRQHLLDLEERDWKQDAEISKNKQDINNLEDTIKLLDTHDTEIGTAKGGGIISLPENVQSSVAPSYKFEGLTLNQLAENGDFRNGTKGWVNSKSSSITPNGYLMTSEDKDIYNILTKTRFKGDIFYLRTSLDVLEDNTDYKSSINDGSSIFDKVLPKGKHRLSVVSERVTDNFPVLYHKSPQNGRYYVISSVYLNLTQTFGAGNEPTKEWCDANLPDYFEGDKSVQAPMRVKSVGKNLISVSNLLKPYSHTKILSLNSYFRPKGYRGGVEYYIPTVIGETYSISKKDLGVPSRVGVQRITSQTETGYIVSQTETDYIEFKAETNITIISLDTYSNKIDEGDTIVENICIVRGKHSEYIPYTESNLYINNQLELKSVGTTKDYIENGKLYKNIKRYYFTSKDEWILRENYAGDNFRYYMNLPFEYKTSGAGVEGELVCNNFTPTSNVLGLDDKRESGTIALYRENATMVYLTLDKKVDDVNSVIPEGTFIDVILPETEVSNLNTSGLIVNKPNGTIFIEPVTNLTAFYNDGLDVSKLTIKEVESFSSFKDGNYQDLDVSKVSINDGKLTHPDAVNGLCYLVYRYDDSPIYGVNSVDYYNSDKTLKSPNGKIWKKVERATDEGELEVTLEEVVKKETVEPALLTEPVDKPNENPDEDTIDDTKEDGEDTKEVE